MDLNDIYNTWVLRGEPRDHNGSVDHEIKMYYLKRTAEEYGLKLFIESGTSHGDGTAAMLPYVERVVTVEAWEEAFQFSANRFKGDSRVNLYFGNSATLLPEILADYKEPALFWLDAHWSGEGTAQLDKDTPIVEELQHISESGFRDQHAIVIDDARGFGDWKDYPTIDEVEEMCKELFPNHKFFVEGDEIFVVPS